VPTGITVAYSGLRYNLDGTSSADSPSASFTLTPKGSCDAR